MLTLPVWLLSLLLVTAACFVFPKEPVIYKDADQIAADGFVQKHGRHGGIHAAG